MINNILTINQAVIRPFAPGRFSLKSVWALGLCFTVALIGYYVFQINAVTRGSFLADVYEKQITNASRESKNLEINYSGLSSLASLEGLATSADYEKVGKVYYIQIVDNAVAVK